VLLLHRALRNPQTHEVEHSKRASLLPARELLVTLVRRYS